MLPGKPVLSRLLGALYEAAADASKWDVFLGQFVRVMRASSAGILMHDMRSNQHSVVQQFGLDPDDVRAYYNHAPAIKDIWTTRAQPVTRTGWMGVSQQLCGATELVRSEFYNECLHKLNIMHGIFGVVRYDGPFIANISVYRTARLEPFDSGELEFLSFFMPHLQRAFRLHFNLADLRTRNASLQNALDLVGTGIFVFASTGRVQFMNRSAADLLARRDGLFCKGESLRAEKPQESAPLEFLIREATATGLGNGLKSGGATFISRKSRPPLRIVVTPVRSLRLGAEQPAAAIVFVIDTAQQIRPRNEILRTLFGLSPAECRLALLSADGRSLAEISQELGVSRNTLKTQIASIYAKTGVSRQSQLVRLLLQFPDECPGQPGE